MRRLADVVVTAAIVHVVAPQRDELRLSSAEIELDEGTQGFLAGHVTKGLADSNALAANFKVVGAERAEGLSRSIIDTVDDLVEHSGGLASLLFDAASRASGGDGRVSDGTLVVGRCRGRDRDREVSFLALLKLDPNDAFRAEESTDATGRRVIRLVAQHDILPTPRERVQKAAFVRGPGAEYDALAVDHQRRGDVVSDFFLDRFLGLEQVYDAKHRTTTFYTTLRRTFDDVAPELAADDYARLDRYIQGQAVGTHVNINTVVDGLPGPDHVKQRFADELASALPDREFDIDEDTAIKLVRRRHFTGANGLRVSVPDDFFPEMVDVEPPSGNDLNFTVTIRTSRWIER